jgi:hypothetical protein
VSDIALTQIASAIQRGARRIASVRILALRRPVMPHSTKMHGFQRLLRTLRSIEKHSGGDSGFRLMPMTKSRVRAKRHLEQFLIAK